MSDEKRVSFSPEKNYVCRVLITRLFRAYISTGSFLSIITSPFARPERGENMHVSVALILAVFSLFASQSLLIRVVSKSEKSFLQ